MKQRMIAITLAFFVLLLSACSGQAASNEEEMIALVEKFQTARNERDWELAASYMAEDVVWETPTGGLTGRETWLATTIADGGRGITEDVQSRRVENNLVIIEMIVKSPDFVIPALAEVVVEDGKIQRYTITLP